MQPDSFEAFCSAFGLGPEESAAFAEYDRHLTETNLHTNLVARSTIADRWSRHYADSAQLLTLIPEDATRLIDIGSGAGFPGIVLGILAQFRHPELQLTLVESIGKKAIFLAECVEKCGLHNVRVVTGRVETLLAQDADVITARAVTALPKLLELAAPHTAGGGLMLFPKGRGAEVELDAARERWSMKVERRPSHTDPDATILLIKEARLKKETMRRSFKAERY